MSTVFSKWFFDSKIEGEADWISKHPHGDMLRVVKMKDGISDVQITGIYSERLDQLLIIKEEKNSDSEKASNEEQNTKSN